MNRIKRRNTAVYHCMSRAVGGEHLLSREAKEYLRGLMWRAAGFCGVEVLAYCLMDNHFHVLVRVPEMSERERLTPAEVLRRYRFLYEYSNVPEYPDAAGMALILEGDDVSLREEWMQRLTRRMHDVSEFMRILKHRLTVWVNQNTNRFGTLWAERFKSVLIQNSPEVLRTVAAYLDLNPVRAGLVEDPAAYRWCSYAEAMGGNEVAAKGLASAMGFREWNEARAGYRVILFGKGGVIKRSGQGAIPREQVRAVLAAGGEVPVAELLRCRVRYICEGAILGSSEFVEAMAAELDSFRPKKQREAAEAGNPVRRKAYPGKICLEGGTELASLRPLAHDPIAG